MSEREPGDPVDRLILDEAAAVLDGPGTLDGLDGTRLPRGGTPAPIAVIGDVTGELALAAAERLSSPVRLFQDGIDAQRALAEAAAPGLIEQHGLEPRLVRGAQLVLARLPKHLAELEEIALLIAQHADPHARLVAGGRVKHMTRGMNEVLACAFERVHASRGRQKSRVLHAAGPLPEARIEPFPRLARDEEAGMLIAAHGGAFAGTRLDPGTRVMLRVLRERFGGHADRSPGAASASTSGTASAPETTGAPGITGMPGTASTPGATGTLSTTGTPGTALDLGCGTGVLASELARLLPRAGITASDRSWAACASARRTIAEAQLAHRVRVLRDDAGSELPDASFDLIVLNPPFHDGHALDERLPRLLFEAAARLLRPGGELLTVANAHLPYPPVLRQLIGPTTVLRRTRGFAVTRSVRARRPGEDAPLHYP